ncbi:MAG: tRNA (guanosine(46)-N7)-methyltransferase TrmB [Nevskiales bacterium]
MIPAESAASGMRRIRSFVRRDGRMTAAQQRALDELWPRYGLELPAAPLDLDGVFGRKAPRVLEIGFGNGETFCAQVQAEPTLDFVGIEVYRTGVARTLRAAAVADLHHLRVFCADANEALDQALPAACLDRIQIYFPDPWPKKRHHKRRLLQTGFAARLARVLKPGGRLLLATDWADYAEQMLAVLNSHPAFANLAADGRFVARPAERMLTRFEQRGMKLGHEVFDLVYVRQA